MIFSHFYETFASFYATPNWQLALRSSPMEQPIKCNLWPLFSKSVKWHEMKISFKWCSVDSFSGWKNQISERSYLLCSWEGMPRTYVWYIRVLLLGVGALLWWNAWIPVLLLLFSSVAKAWQRSTCSGGGGHICSSYVWSLVHVGFHNWSPLLPVLLLQGWLQWESAPGLFMDSLALGKHLATLHWMN